MTCHLSVVIILAVNIFIIVVGSKLPDIKTDVMKIYPKFNGTVENVTATVGRRATLSCTIENLGAHKIGWMKAEDQTILTFHERVVASSGRFSVTHEGYRTWYLHIRDVEENDKGCYMCQVNTIEMQKQIGCLDVLVPPDIITDESSTDITLMEGENATLSCHATGNPEPRITWKREKGQPLLMRSGSRDLVKYDSYTGNDLKLWRLDRRQTGVYYCIASNGIPPAVSKRITLNVYFPPVIVVRNQLLGAPIGTDVTLECHVESYPKSINYWVRNRTKMLMDGPKHVLRETISDYKSAYYIVIKMFDQSDVGTYSCISTNSIGNAEGTLRVYELQGDIPFGKSSKNKVAMSSACPKHMHIVTVAALTVIWAKAIG
ncbi:lachesin-like isoform X1 [Daktulosphaira vitifoliae]|uniref:lachesin-like isoform X1 n=1 Tax=Daktulosphaira vitifoliae TaxID=58002 RepID=UPI0021AAF391|nr:lachesin-like isoform X1 [Daktulosphaira vitifoliae]